MGFKSQQSLSRKFDLSSSLAGLETALASTDGDAVGQLELVLDSRVWTRTVMREVDTS